MRLLWFARQGTPAIGEMRLDPTFPLTDTQVLSGIDTLSGGGKLAFSIVSPDSIELESEPTNLACFCRHS